MILQIAPLLPLVKPERAAFHYRVLQKINAMGQENVLEKRSSEINTYMIITRAQTTLNRFHYNDVIMSAMASQITSLTIVYPPVYSHANQRKHQSSMSLAFVWGIHRWPVNSPHKGPVTRKVFSFDDAIMRNIIVFIPKATHPHIFDWQNFLLIFFLRIIRLQIHR